MQYFCEDITVSKMTKLLGINRNTINRYFNLFRICIYTAMDAKKVKITGEFELDESYFGAKRVRSKKGRAATGKTPVFGLLKRNGEVKLEIVNNCTKGQLMPINKRTYP